MRWAQGGFEIPVPTMSEWLADLSERNKNRKIKEDFESWSYEVKKLYETLLKAAINQAEVGGRSVSYPIHLHDYEPETYAKIPAMLEYMRKVGGLRAGLEILDSYDILTYEAPASTYMATRFEGIIQISW